MDAVIIYSDGGKLIRAYTGGSELLPKPEDVEGKLVGSTVGGEEGRRIRSLFAETLFVGEPQQAVVTLETGVTLRLNSERMTSDKGERFVIVSVVVIQLPDSNITDAETEVLKRLCDDMTSREIAGDLKCSESTIDTYRQRLREKTGAKGTAGLVRWAIRNGHIKV